MTRLLTMLLVAVPLLFTTGCSRSAVGGAAVGAGAAGAAYEYSNKQALEELEQEYRSGQISRDEYLRRKNAIEEKSLLY